MKTSEFSAPRQEITLGEELCLVHQSITKNSQAREQKTLRYNNIALIWLHFIGHFTMAETSRVQRAWEAVNTGVIRKSFHLYLRMAKFTALKIASDNLLFVSSPMYYLISIVHCFPVRLHF